MSGDRALTETRIKGITLQGRFGPGASWDTLARPTSMHGAAVQVRLREEQWRATGYDEFRICVGGYPVHAGRVPDVGPELDEFLLR